MDGWMLFFTGVVAAATAAQAVFAWRLWQLQQTVQMARDRVEVFGELTFFITTLDRTGNVKLLIGNLCSFPIWLEKARIHVLPKGGSKGTYELELHSVLGCEEDREVALHKEFYQAAMAGNDIVEIPFQCTAWAEVFFQGNGRSGSVVTKKCSFGWRQPTVFDFEEV